MNDLTVRQEFKSIQQLQDALVKFKKACNETPKTKEWQKYAKTNYLPISYVEDALDELLFYGWNVEVLNWSIQLNSCCAQIRLHFIHPATGEKSFMDGLGAAPIQVNSDSKPMDITNIKSAGIQMALPCAKAYALKDAAEHLGKRFGRDIAREKQSKFKPIIKTTEEKEESYYKAVKAWEASKKDQPTLDAFINQARKQGIEKQFIAYVQGKNNDN